MDKTFNENNGDFYDLEYFLSLEYRRFSGAHSGHTENILKTFKTLNLQGKRVLDVGCGGGFFTQEMAKLGAEVVGCDYSQYAIKFAQERYPNLKIVQQSAYDIDKLGINNLDFIFAIELVEHLSQPEIFFEKVLKILNPQGGRLIVTTDNEEYLFEKVPFNRLRNLLMRISAAGRAQRLIAKVEAYRRQFKNYHQGHINLNSARTWIERIEKAGFSIEKVAVFSAVAIPLLDAIGRFLPLFRRGDHVLVIAKVPKKDI